MAHGWPGVSLATGAGSLFIGRYQPAFLAVACCRWLSKPSWLHAALKASLQEAMLQVLLAKSRGSTMLVGSWHWL